MHYSYIITIIHALKNKKNVRIQSSKNGTQFPPAQYLHASIYNLRSPVFAQMTIVFDSVLLVALSSLHKKVSAKYFDSSFLNAPSISGFSSFLVCTKVRVEKYNCREKTLHIRSNLFSYQVKHVKTTTLTNANTTLLWHNVFTLRSMYKGLPSHSMQCKPKSKNSAGDFGRQLSLNLACRCNEFTHIAEMSFGARIFVSVSESEFSVISE